MRDPVRHGTLSEASRREVRRLRAAEHSEPANELPRVIIDGSTSWKRWWGDLVAYRGALYSLASRNIRSRYKQAVLGVAWAVLQPVLQVAVFTVVFSRIAAVDTAGIPYPLFALAGLLSWNVFSKIVTDGSISLAANQNIITKLFFPRIYLVLSAGASALVDAAVGIVLLSGLMAVYAIAPTMKLLLAFPILCGVMLLAFGVAAFLAAVNARWRDVQHTVPFLLQLGLFATPIVYPATVISEHWRWLLVLNPLAALAAGFRAAVLGQSLPPSTAIVPSLAVTVGIVGLGAWYFSRAERTIVDVV